LTLPVGYATYSYSYMYVVYVLASFDFSFLDVAGRSTAEIVDNVSSASL